MKLNSETKRGVKVGDVLHFYQGETYRVTNVITAARGCVCFTLRDVDTHRVIYSYPASKLYGADIFPRADDWGDV